MPIGYDDFAEIIDNKLEYVDKSLFIKAVLDDIQTKVAVITRPRRFGKTLNLSMLHYFLAPEVLGRPTKGLFDHLKIAHAEGNYIAEHQGNISVVSITFKEIKEADFKPALLSFSKLMSRSL